jgi:hypothetical protein
VRPSGEGKSHVRRSAFLTELGLFSGSLFYSLSWQIVESSKQVMQMLKSVRSEFVVNYILAMVIMEEKSLDTTDFI